MRAGFKSGATEYTANHQTMSTADGSLKLDSSVRMFPSSLRSALTR